MCEYRSGIYSEIGQYRWTLSQSPEIAIVVSVDEKPSIQALERSTGYVAKQNGKIVQDFKCNGQDLTRQPLHQGIISSDKKRFWKSLILVFQK